MYLDESGFAVNSPRRHGYSSKGNRCYGIDNWNPKERINVIGALLNNKLINSVLCKFTIDSDVFHQWVIDELLPSVPEKSIIVMDNATFHKRSDTQASIKNAGHTLLYQPPYSPQLNPIEKRWAYLKSVRKKWRISVETLLYHFI